MDFDKNDYYKLIAPRPTVCVSTIDEEGVPNIAPYSFASPVSFSPPLIGISVGKGKDTILNARETGGFVVAPVTEEWMKEGVGSEVSLSRSESEFEEVGLTESKSVKVEAPGVGESHVNIECDYWNEFEMGDHYFLVGEVVHISATEDAVENGRINLEKLGTVGHVSGKEFCISKEITEIERR